MAKKNMCPKCGEGPFKGEQGMRLHETRKHSAFGKTWGSTRGMTRKGKGKRKNHSGAKETIEEILAEHPEGYQVKDIFRELKRRGHKVNINYISSAAATMPNLMRIERGVYRLKEMPKPNVGTRLVHQAQAEAHQAQAEAQQQTEIPREALLLRIDTLILQNRALRNAHMSLLNGVTADG